ncbi:MAG: hypothetical protein WKF59_14785 [Chitinophagaceae bacterium]
MVEIIKCIVDDSEFEEFKMDYGKTIVMRLCPYRWMGCGHCC